MDFYVNGQYSAFEELMHYYHWSFYAYYFLVLIVFVNCIKAIVSFRAIKKCKASNISLSYMDLIVSILAGIGLIYGMIFQGVLSDISSKHSKIWGDKMIVLCIVAFVLFIIQWIFILKNKNN
ncbi:hypothetical protein [Anaerophilus nitritogenes]|uniref:hypothetical protein n=1 Tax=Anaerophilus nitritogenes TaxID=2498136 RepID=UPI00101D4BBA|nr:hypothetical protein [Anaerophilus nitritogenes]